MGEKWILWFEELGQEYADTVGKKCANLGEMTKMGLPAPPGFALTIEAYRKFMDETGATEELQAFLRLLPTRHNLTSSQFGEASKTMRKIVESKSMPRDMQDTIAAYYDALCRKCTLSEMPVSARSSGAVSHPGQYETFLNIGGKSGVVANIIKVWSSSFNTRSLANRSNHGLPLWSDPIGVAVLRMVNSRSAGVAFTADPNTGDTSKIIIEANWGLGESVVGGEVTPDRYVLDKNTLEVLNKTSGEKTHHIVAGSEGTVVEEVTRDRKSAFCLSDDEAKEVGRLGRILEEHFKGVPQDVEWGIDPGSPQTQNVVLLQTRPAVISKKTGTVDTLMEYFKFVNRL